MTSFNGVARNLKTSDTKINKGMLDSRYSEITFTIELSVNVLPEKLFIVMTGTLAEVK